MRGDFRFARLLHVLIHMEGREGVLTSESLAKMLNTNAVVVRRMMAGLRDRGFVESGKGHGGGWALAKSLSEITLFDVYEAIGAPAVFAFGQIHVESTCLVEKAVNAALTASLDAARAMLLDRFRQISVNDIAKDYGSRSGVCAGLPP